MQRRSAFLIANQHFRPDSGLTTLRGPLHDVTDLSEVLGDPKLGQFTVFPFVNATSAQVKSVIEEELEKSGKGDLVLIYYTGHGKLDRQGGLCLATADTKAAALQTTSIPSRQVKDLASNSNCESVVLILDCCYSGAATDVSRGDVESSLSALGAGSGLYILSASSEIQTASEVQTEHGVFGEFTTSFLKGIRSGEADVDGDGEITLQEIFKFVKSDLARQSPKIFAAKAGADPVISKAPPRTSAAVRTSKPAPNDAVEAQDQRTFTLRVVQKLPHPDQIVDVAFNRDDSAMATVCDDGVVRIFDLPSFEIAGKLRANPHSLRSATWSRGGSEIVTSDTMGSLKFWRQGQPIGEIKTGSRGLCCAQYSPNGLTLLAGAEDGTVSLWRAQLRERVWQKRLHRKNVSSVRFSADGRMAVTTSYDGQAAVIATADGSEIGRFSRHADELTAAFFISAETSRLPIKGVSCVSTGLEGEVCIWPIRQPDSAFVASRHQFWARALTYCDRAQLIISGGYDASVKLIDLKTSNVFEAARLEHGPVVCVRSSHSERTLVITTHDRMAYVLTMDYKDL